MSEKKDTFQYLRQFWRLRAELRVPRRRGAASG
jgi:hypothetical protein